MIMATNNWRLFETEEVFSICASLQLNILPLCSLNVNANLVKEEYYRFHVFLTMPVMLVYSTGICTCIREALVWCLCTLICYSAKSHSLYLLTRLWSLYSCAWNTSERLVSLRHASTCNNALLGTTQEMLLRLPIWEGWEGNKNTLRVSMGMWGNLSILITSVQEKNTWLLVEIHHLFWAAWLFSGSCINIESENNRF